MQLQSRNHVLDLSVPRVMGILNVTPDSFSDGGKYDRVESAVARAREMILEGASIIDIGGESTGPGSKDVLLAEELRRVLPVLHAVAPLCGFCPWLSVDTYKAEVARRSVDAGVLMVNDVTALRGDPEMAKVIAETGVSVVLMYAKDRTPRTTRDAVQYDDVVAHILGFFEERLAYAFSRGIRKEQIVLDPGMGAFVSADPQYSMEILERLREFLIGYPILVGPSRKSFLGSPAKRGDLGDLLAGSLRCAETAISNGAHIVRMHDVSETSGMIKESGFFC